MTTQDKTHRFIFDNADVRGEIVTLQDSFAQATQHQNLSPGLKRLLGDFLAAAALLSESMKFEGLLTLQVRGDGPVPLVMAEASHQGQVRGIVKANPEAENYQDKPQLLEAVGKAILTLTIDPVKGERYQGIVPLEHGKLADCLSAYFQMSEQLPSQLWLFSNENACGGLMLQSMPAQKDADPESRADTWNTLLNLSNTVQEKELFTLQQEELLYRLYHEMQCRIFPARDIRYQCSCSRQRSANAIISLGHDQAMSLFEELEEVAIDCQFCGKSYKFNQGEVSALFSSDSNPIH